MRTSQCPEPSRRPSKAMSSLGSSSQGQKRSSKSSNTSYTSKSSAYDRDFEQKCVDHGIHMPGRIRRPDNWDDLQNALVSSRLSLSPSRFSDGAFDRFCEAEAEARDEDDVTADSLPTSLGEKRRDHPSARKVPYGNMADMAPDVFKKAEPDLYWGARPEQIDRRVRQDLDHQIVPSTKDTYPVAPNFFLEVKGPDGSAAKKTMQACYAGAIGARGMHALQGYGQAEPTYDNKAYTFSSTYHDGTLKLYAHHPTQPSRLGESPQYHMTPLRGFLLTDSPQTFRQGVGAFRNARDLAKEQRERFIEQVNAVARAQSVDTMSFDTSHDTVTSMQERLIDSDTSADELALDYSFAMSRTKRQKKEQTRPSTLRSMREEPSSTRGEPRSMRESHSTQEYFLPLEGISEIVIKEHITRYCGTGAEVTTVMSKVCGKHVFFIEREANAS
jgi:hypothetical protein